MRRFKGVTGLWRTATFRLAIVFASIFGIGAAALLLMLDFGIARFAEDELRNALRHQMAIMRADAQLEGGAALANILREHVRTDTVHRYHYLVIPPSGPTFNSGLPESAIQIDGFGTAEMLAEDVSPGSSQASVEMLLLTERVADGTFMAVGRESYPLDDLRIGLHQIAIVGSIVLVLLAVFAGAVAGVLFLRRLELVNATTCRIMDGNLSERIPSIGFGQEFNDLTQNLNAMLDRLEAAMVGMRQISTDLAHDLRMPLTRLRNRLEELSPATDAQAAQIECTIEEADELLSLFNAMLRIARLESGGIPLDFTPVDLSLLIERAVEAYQPAAEESGRRLIGSPNGAQFIVGNAALLNQILANLIDNGIRHTSAGATVEVEARSNEGIVLLSVKDNGAGVPDSELSNLTKRFYRLDLSRGLPGTGLGLTLVAAIVELHKAEMRISNRHPGLCVEVIFAEASV